jgi:hypothetical protein
LICKGFIRLRLPDIGWFAHAFLYVYSDCTCSREHVLSDFTYILRSYVS